MKQTKCTPQFTLLMDRLVIPRPRVFKFKIRAYKNKEKNMPLHRSKNTEKHTGRIETKN